MPNPPEKIEKNVINNDEWHATTNEGYRTGGKPWLTTTTMALAVRVCR